jgi:hypothetical protein
MKCSVAHLHINRFKASCVSREQDLQANSLRLKLQLRKIALVEPEDLVPQRNSPIVLLFKLFKHSPHTTSSPRIHNQILCSLNKE